MYELLVKLQRICYLFVAEHRHLLSNGEVRFVLLISGRSWPARLALLRIHSLQIVVFRLVFSQILLLFYFKPDLGLVLLEAVPL